MQSKKHVSVREHFTVHFLDPKAFVEYTTTRGKYIRYYYNVLTRDGSCKILTVGPTVHGFICRNINELETKDLVFIINEFDYLEYFVLNN